MPNLNEVLWRGECWHILYNDKCNIMILFFCGQTLHIYSKTSVIGILTLVKLKRHTLVYEVYLQWKYIFSVTLFMNRWRVLILPNAIKKLFSGTGTIILFIHFRKILHAYLYIGVGTHICFQPQYYDCQSIRPAPRVNCDMPDTACTVITGVSYDQTHTMTRQHDRAPLTNID